MKIPNPDDTITITFKEFSDICADVSVAMVHATKPKYGKGVGDTINGLTSIYASELVRRLFKTTTE